MARRIFSLILIALLALCGCTAVPQETSEQTVAVPSAQATPAPPRLLEGVAPADVREITYHDNSAPPDTPVTTYTDAEELEKILDMFAQIELTGEAGEADANKVAPGDYCSYTVYLKSGETVSIGRAGRALSYAGKRWAYRGTFACQLHRDEVFLWVAGSSGMPANSKLEMRAGAYDPQNTYVVGEPTLKCFDGNRWNTLACTLPTGGARTALCDLPAMLDLSAWPDVGYGSYRLIYDCVLPSGETTLLEAQFDIFEA